MRLSSLTDTARAVADTSGRLQKIHHLATLLARLPPDEIEMAVGFLTGVPRQGSLGIGPVVIQAARTSASAGEASLELSDVDATLEAIAHAAGAGSTAMKVERLREMLARATADEQDFLVRLLYGELRQGALEGVLVEAVARAAGTEAARVRRAAMLAGSLAPIARTALVEGPAALDRFSVRPFHPLQPMLAASADDVTAAIGELGEAALEYKIDGARIQIHKVDDDVRVYSRSLRDVTAAVPEIVEAARTLPAREAILDGEAIALRPDGTPHPFQVTMQRFGRKLDVDRLRQTLPISPVVFDCVYIDGASLIDEPLSRRTATLSAMAPSIIVPRIVTADLEAAARFVARALAAGHEGVMAKSPSAGYAAGRRGQAWLKVKQAVTLDLVVLAVEWGSGRRHGTLSNLHLGARDAERGGFVMLGKTFKGLTDEMLAWQTAKLLELETSRDGHIVYVRPELVVEVAFNEIQASPRYPGGVALRFARVKRYRTDKRATDADTIHTVKKLFKSEA